MHGNISSTLLAMRGDKYSKMLIFLLTSIIVRGKFHCWWSTAGVRFEKSSLIPASVFCFNPTLTPVASCLMWKLPKPKLLSQSNQKALIIAWTSFQKRSPENKWIPDEIRMRRPLHDEMTSLIYLFIKDFCSRTLRRDIDEALKISLDGFARRPFYMNSLIFRLKASSKLCYDGERVEKGFKGFSGNFFWVSVVGLIL